MNASTSRCRVRACCSVAVVVLAAGLGAGRAVAQGAPDPADRIMIANRVVLADSAIWRRIRMTFLPAVAPAQWPVELRLFEVAWSAGFGCMGEPSTVASLDLLASAPLALETLPVQDRHRYWVDMPPRDEVWARWQLEHEVGLDHEKGYLLAIDAARGDWVGLRVVPETFEVATSEETSLVSFDQGATWICLDSAAVWAIVGKQIDPNCSPLLRIEIDPDA